MNRRAALAGLAALAASPAAAHPLFATRRPDGLYAFGPQEPLFDFASASSAPVIIDRFDCVELSEESILLRVHARDGATGVTVASPNKWAEVRPLLPRLVLPILIGQDARRIEQLLWRFSREMYEYAGAPMWNAWGHAETAVLDLLGQVSGRTVASFLGPIRRREIPFYIGSSRRARPDAAAAEAEALAEALARTGCTGVKIKVGARMSRNRDAGGGGWTPAIVRETRRRLGDAVTIYADANGSFDAPTALEVCRLLEDHGVAMLEEPCPGDDLEMTGQVSRALRARGAPLLIASGENEGNPTIWRQWIDGRHLDVCQPDPQYGGGLIQCAAIARYATAAGLKVNPHWPRQDHEQAPLVHLCAAAEGLWGLQEHRLRPRVPLYASTSAYRLERGVMRLPDDPGFGVSYDPAVWKTAQTL